jgi:hypothetical protein
MYCTQCRESVEDTETYCSACGASVKHHTPPVETPEEKIPDSENTTPTGGIWGTLKVLGLTAVILVGLGAVALYGLLLYSSCSTTGSVTLPVVRKTIECERSPEAIAREQKEESRKAFMEQWAERAAATSPYDSVQCVGTDYQLYIVLIPHDDSVQGKEVLTQYQDGIIAFIRKIGFPKHLIMGRMIGIVSPTFGGGAVTVRGHTYQVPEAGDAHARVSTNGTMLLYGSALGDRLYAAIAHELGHLVGNTFTTGDWVEWARIRGDGDTRSTLGTAWETSVEEDFAEEFKRYAGGYKGDPKIWDNQTVWGKGAYLYSAYGVQAPIVPASAEVQSFIKTRLERLNSTTAHLSGGRACRP